MKVCSFKSKASPLYFSVSMLQRRRSPRTVLSVLLELLTVFAINWILVTSGCLTGSSVAYLTTEMGDLPH